MALAAIDRSAGQCEAFWGRADDEVLLYLADKFGLDPFLFDVYTYMGIPTYIITIAHR